MPHFSNKLLQNPDSWITSPWEGAAPARRSYAAWPFQWARRWFLPIQVEMGLIKMFSLQDLVLFIISGKDNVLLYCGQNRSWPCLFSKAQVPEIREQNNRVQQKEWSVIICSLSSEALSSPKWFRSENSAQFCKLPPLASEKSPRPTDSAEIASVCHAVSVLASHDSIWLQIGLAQNPEMHSVPSCLQPVTCHGPAAISLW